MKTRNRKSPKPIEPHRNAPIPTARPKVDRLAFARKFTELMTEGVSADGNRRGRWTDEALARALDVIDGRRPEHEHAPNAVGKWRKGQSLPESIDGLLAIFLGESETRGPERDAFLQVFKAARLEKFGPILKGGVASGMPTWTEVGSELRMERETRPGDAKAARDPGERST